MLTNRKTSLLLLLLLSTALFFLTEVTLSAAPLRLALLGEPKELLDLLSVELSQNTAVQLLERTAIEQVLQEHRLAASNVEQLLRLFPYTDLLAVFSQEWGGKSGRMLVINARNSHRLADLPWTGPATETSAECARAIDLALHKLQNEAPLCLAIALMRKVAIDPHQDKALTDWKAAFERKLLEHPEIQLLEREHLGMVTDERSLTRQSFALTSSARLLMLECETGESNAAINLKLFCTDTGGQVLLRLQQSDILRQPAEAITQLVDKLVSGLLALPPVSPIAKGAEEEAETFYQSCLNNALSREDALQKIQAAVALAPNHETYRHAEISASAFQVYQIGKPEGLQEARRLLALIRKFQSDFPRTTLPYFPDQALRDLSHLSHATIFRLEESRVRYDDKKTLFLEQLVRELEEFYAEIRPLVRQDMRRNPAYAYEPADGVSASEQKNYRQYLQNFYFSYQLYLDRDLWLQEYFSDYQLLLQHIEQENRRKPYLNHKYLEGFLPYHQLLRDNNCAAFKRFLAQDRTFLPFLENSSLPFGRANALELRTVLELLQNIPRPSKMPEILRAFFTAMEEIWPGCFEDYQYWRRILTSGCFPIICRKYYRQPENQALNCLDEYLERSSAVDLLTLLKDACISNGDDQAIAALLPYATQIQTLNYRYLTEYKIANTLRELAFAIWEQPFFANRAPGERFILKLSAPQQELLQAVNRSCDMQSGRFEDALQHASPLICCHAAQDGEEVLLFLGQGGSYPHTPKTHLASISPNGQMKLLPYAVPFDERSVWYGEDDRYDMYGLECDEQHIVLCNHCEAVVIERATGQARKFRHLVFGLTGLKLQDNRIYLLGDDTFQSLDLRGENRKIHFSQQRLDKLNALDKGGRACDLTAIGGGRLLFKVTHKLPKTVWGQEEIWLYDSADDTLRRILELPTRKNYSLTSARGQVLLVEAQKQRSIIYALDDKDWQLQTIATPPTKDKWRPASHQLNGGDGNGPLAYPLVLDGEYLWCGGLYPAAINLAEPEKSPLLWLPTCKAVFKVGSRIFFLRHNYWFSVQGKDGPAAVSRLE
jgi:hypothetical protein